MKVDWPPAAGAAVARARLKAEPEDFRVFEELGFEPEGEGEHAFLHLEKRGLNTQDLAQRLSTASGTHPRDIGFSGMKDRQAVTRQWFSVPLAGRPEPDWSGLEAGGDVVVLAAHRHRRKLKRGVHRGNRFEILLRDVEGDRDAIEARLAQLSQGGAPNYFGRQRFGRDGANVMQARQWLARGMPRVSRNKRSVLLSSARGYLFNQLLAARVRDGDWDRPRDGDTCILAGTRSRFSCETVDDALLARAQEGDLHPALPLWGRGELPKAVAAWAQPLLAGDADLADGLERAGLELDWRPTRLLADDFSWQFCDDGGLRLAFRLGTGSYATALLAELVETH